MNRDSIFIFFGMVAGMVWAEAENCPIFDLWRENLKKILACPVLFVNILTHW